MTREKLRKESSLREESRQEAEGKSDRLAGTCIITCLEDVKLQGRQVTMFTCNEAEFCQYKDAAQRPILAGPSMWSFRVVLPCGDGVPSCPVEGAASLTEPRGGVQGTDSRGILTCQTVRCETVRIVHSWCESGFKVSLSRE